MRLVDKYSKHNIIHFDFLYGSDVCYLLLHTFLQWIIITMEVLNSANGIKFLFAQNC